MIGAAQKTDNGSTVVEMVLIIPAFMLLLMTLIQFALWVHAAQVAQLAASEGDRAARAFDGGAAAGVAQAQSILKGPGSDLSSSEATVLVLAGDETRMTVTGTAVSLIPGMSFPVSAVTTGPLQEFRSSE
jgi:Flp pilus assembly protein TadG